MKSFSIIRTNVGLTSNLKVIINSDYKMYLESIDSDPMLSSNDYKKFEFNKDSYYDDIIPNFFSGLPVDISFKVKYDDDNDIMYNDFSHQFDDIYQMGCRDIINNKNYNESYECFAPLYLGNEIPSNFIVFRVDGPGLINLTKDSFRDEIINNLKCVKVFDMNNSPLGEWMNLNFKNNSLFPNSPFYMDFRNLEFSTWNGIDYDSGGYTQRSLFMDSSIEKEMTFTSFEKLVYDGFKNNKLIFPNIVNLSFLFDDEPATPTELRKWSLNRYLGFYMNSLDKVRSFSPYKLPDLQSDITVVGGNIIKSSFEDPFKDGYENVKNPFVEINGIFYKVEKYTRTYNPTFQKLKLNTNVYSDEITETNGDFYKIISDLNFSGLTFSSFNSKLIEVDSNEEGYYMKYNNGSNIISDSEFQTADVWLLKINDKYHVVSNKSLLGVTYSFINSDYGFSLDEDYFKYWTNSIDSSYTTKLNVRVDTEDINLISFDLLKCNFTDISDFDTSIVDTKFSNFEYQKSDTLCKTDESKFYTVDYSSNTNPKLFNDYIVNGQVVHFPCSSEYTANGELFSIVDNELNELWRKNPTRVKWGYQKSLCCNDYPYLLNNSFLSEDFNRNPNPFNPIPNRHDRNLDYFYSINSSTTDYSYHTLHIQDVVNGMISSTFSFDFDSYIGTQSDYFSSFFMKKQILDRGNIITNVNKYSILEKGDNIIPNSTLFRGLKFDIYNVDTIQVADSKISTLNLSSNNSFEDWKLSVLLTNKENSTLQWNIIDNWEHGVTYSTNDIVSYYDILYTCISDSYIIDPNLNPSLSPSEWIPYDTNVLWTPEPYKFYSTGDFVFNSGEYYVRNSSSSGISFWTPFNDYDINDKVIFENQVWVSTTGSNTFQPNGSAIWRDSSSTAYKMWEMFETSTNWDIVELWSPLYTYYNGLIVKPNSIIKNTDGYPYVVYNNVLYRLNSSSSSNDLPNISSKWTKINEIYPNNDMTYKSNDLLILNDRYYLCTSNSGFDKLNSGITIYFNYNYSNMLINIDVSDNTLPNLSSTDRDDLYNSLYSILSANNFSLAINDLSNKHGFSNYIKYVIINREGIKEYSYDNDISKLPIKVVVSYPDNFNTLINSLVRKSLTINDSQFKSKRQLLNNKITTYDTINYYNGNPLATEISISNIDSKTIENFSGLKNNIYNSMWRYSGNYSPIFYTIQLFETGEGNYIFDTTLTDFGIMKERILSKVNIYENILKFKSNPDIKSIYPMIDEFGYTFADYFIFKSTWDREYYVECSNVDIITTKANTIIK